MQTVLLFLLIINIFAVKQDGETAVLILARGGSKGVRLKNLQTVGGVSLLSRAINTAKDAGFNDVTVSTDNPLIALEGIKSGAKVFQRARIAATDWAPSIWGAAEFLANRDDIDILVLLQATSPFVQPRYLSDALKKIEHPVPYDCVFSVARIIWTGLVRLSYKLRWKILKNTVTPVNFNIYARPRRQDWDGELLENGAFYIARRNLIMNGSFQNDNCTMMEMSAAESFEVDSSYDLQVANALLSSNLV